MLKIAPCPCGHKICKDWHVDYLASVQGVKFTQEQAEAVAFVLSSEKLTKDFAARYRSAR